MIIICMGTAAELIKLQPVLTAATRMGRQWIAVATGQSGESLRRQWEEFGHSSSRLIWLMPSQEDLSHSTGALKWFLKGLFLSRKEIKDTIQKSTGLTVQPGDTWMVHGDTLSTLLGSLYGWRLGLTVAHVEAGLRSSRLFEPFPEEITRRLVSCVARLHFAPNSKALENLKRAHVRGKLINTHANTLIEAVFQKKADASLPVDLRKPYVVANLHRHENLNSVERWNELIDICCAIAGNFKVYFVMHAPTERRLKCDPTAIKRFADLKVEILPRLGFVAFQELLSQSEFVVTDGGSNQEECSYLGKPCLILRNATERSEGLEGPCLLAGFDREKIKNFLKSYKALAHQPMELMISPSAKILEEIQ